MIFRSTIVKVLSDELVKAKQFRNYTLFSYEHITFM